MAGEGGVARSFYSKFFPSTSSKARTEDHIPSRWADVRRIVRVMCQLFPGFHRPIRRRALLVGIKYSDQEDRQEQLRWTHEDVDRLYDTLVGLYGFQPADIVVMKDQEGIAGHLWPTTENLCRELEALTRDCAPRDRFVFLYAGHAGQKRERVPFSEADGMDEYIVPCDAEDELGYIDDDKLYRYLVEPLKARCKLVAFLDACNSGTLLDLTHNKCLVLDGWKGNEMRTVRRTREILAGALGIPISDRDGVADVRQVETREEMELVSVGCTAIPPVGEMFRPWRFCHGLCRRAFHPHDPYVICFSACDDGERALDMRGLTMTKVLVHILKQDHRPPLELLISTARDDHASKYKTKAEKYYKRKTDKNNAERGRVGRACSRIIGWCGRRHAGMDFAPEEERPTRFPPLVAKFQISSNFPRFTRTERFWI